MKVVVFDFDDTLTTFDTIYPFFKFCNKDNFLIYNLKKIIWMISLTLYKLNICTNDNLKRIGIKLFLNGFTKNELIYNSKEFIKNIQFHENIIRLLEVHLNKGDKVIISSASFREYISVFSNEYKNLEYVSSELEYLNSKVTGIEFNNYGKKKEIYFKERDLQIDKLYTDSFSDYSLACIANETCIVDKYGNTTVVKSINEFKKYFKRK